MSKNITPQLKVDVVLGLRYGDEGKGKVVHHLLNKYYHPEITPTDYHLSVRFNGGPNAGHTIYIGKNKKVVTHIIPTGILSGIQSFIGSCCVIDPVRFEKELSEIEKAMNISDNSLRKLLYISKDAHIISPENIEEDRKNNLVGTTGSGIGPTYSKKALRTNQRVIDWLNQKNSEESFFGCQVIDQYEFLLNIIEKSYQEPINILMEGAQGFELDIDWGHYPYCTSSTCGIAGVYNFGIRSEWIGKVYGLVKAYDTYVGKMEFGNPNDPNLSKIQEEGGEFGSTTGRKRQVDYLDLYGLKKAIILNNVTNLISNKNDILEKIDSPEICSFYTDKNKKVKEISPNITVMKDKIIEYFSKDNLTKNLKIIFSENPRTI